MSEHASRHSQTLAEKTDLETIKELRERSHALEQEDIRRSLELLQEAIDLASGHVVDQEVYLPELGECLHQYGQLSYTLADYGTALAAYNQALEIFTRLRNFQRVASAQNRIGVIYGLLGDHSTSIQHLLEANRIYEEVGDASEQATTLNNLGFSHVLIEQHEKALYYLTKSLALARRGNNKLVLANILDSLCQAYRGLKDYKQALAYGLESIQVSHEIGEKRGECEYCISIGVLFLDQGELEQAKTYFKKSLEVSQKLGFRREEADALRQLSRVYFLQGKSQEGFQTLHRALEIATEIQARREMFKSHADLAAAYKKKGDFERALAHYEHFHLIKEEVFNDQADLRFKSLETAFRLEQAQKEAEIYHLKNQALQREIEERTEALAIAEHYAAMDPLTGLYNRRHFLHLAEHAFDEALYKKNPLCVIMLDLDHFKRVNDSFGHLIGDDVLVEVANLIRSCLRTRDVLGRYGGEEFAIILPETTTNQGILVCERIRSTIEAAQIKTARGTVRVTVSGGIGMILDDDTFGTLTLMMLFNRADQALYQAKQSGRNQIFVFKA